MSTIKQLLAQSIGIESDTPLLDAQVLLSHVLQCSRTYLYTWPEKVVKPAAAQQYLQLLERRKQGEPIAYLVGFQEFWSLQLEVSSATLIPRADTELLVEKALALPMPQSARVLDLGTGTGAIALALASEKSQWYVVAVDRQIEAVALAQRNADKLKVDNIKILPSDWFSAVDGKFDLIVSNPPYVPAADPHLGEGDVRFEPRTALVAGDSGLTDIQRIITDAKSYLNLKGWLVIEHGFDQHIAVQSIFLEHGFAAVQSCVDLAGLPRITLGKREL